MKSRRIRSKDITPERYKKFHDIYHGVPLQFVLDPQDDYEETHENGGNYNINRHIFDHLLGEKARVYELIAVIEQELKLQGAVDLFMLVESLTRSEFEQYYKSHSKKLRDAAYELFDLCRNYGTKQITSIADINTPIDTPERQSEIDKQVKEVSALLIGTLRRRARNHIEEHHLIDISRYARSTDDAEPTQPKIQSIKHQLRREREQKEDERYVAQLIEQENQEQDFLYALNLQSQFDLEAELFNAQIAEDRKSTAQERRVTRQSKAEVAMPQTTSMAADGIENEVKSAVESTQSADEKNATTIRDNLTKLYTKLTHLPTNDKNTKLIDVVQKARLALGEKYPANTSCMFGDDITAEKIKKHEQIVLDDGQAYDLASFVEYHNQRLAGQNTDKSELDTPGKYIINPATRQPYSPTVVQHITDKVKKYNAGKPKEEQLKLFNVKGINPGDFSEAEIAAKAKAEEEKNQANERLLADLRREPGVFQLQHMYDARRRPQPVPRRLPTTTQVRPAVSSTEEKERAAIIAEMQAHEPELLRQQQGIYNSIRSHSSRNRFFAAVPRREISPEEQFLQCTAFLLSLSLASHVHQIVLLNVSISYIIASHVLHLEQAMSTTHFRVRI